MKKVPARKPYATRSYPTPVGAPSQELLNEITEDNDSKPKLVINDLTIKSMPELRELAIQYGFSSDDFADIQKNRDVWAEYFRNLTGKEYDPNDKTSEFYRGV